MIGCRAGRLPVRFPLEVGGIEPPSPGAYRKPLQVYQAYRVVEEGAADLRAFPPVSRSLSPGPSGPKPGRASVSYEPSDRSRRRSREPVVYATYAARARLPLSLAIEVLPNQEIGGSTCNLRSGPLGSRPVHPRSYSLVSYDTSANRTESILFRQSPGQGSARSITPPPRTKPSSS